MNNELFDTKEKIDAAISNFTTLVEHPGWKLFESIVKANMEILKKQILSGADDETKEQIDRLRDRLRAYEDIYSTPHQMIKKLKPDKLEEARDDPYETLAEAMERKAVTSIV